MCHGHKRRREFWYAYSNRQERKRHLLTQISDTGANASKEEAEEALEDGVSQVNNVVDAFRLEKVEGVYNTVKDYQAQLKGKDLCACTPLRSADSNQQST